MRQTDIVYFCINLGEHTWLYSASGKPDALATGDLISIPQE